MPDLDTRKLVQPVRDIARAAGAAIMEIYRGAVAVETKSDGSPVTEADRRAHRLIVEALGDLTPSIPILSEEIGSGAYAERRHWRELWLVDPLDGTREFINQKDEFTVNIALVRDRVPVFGIVGIPAKEVVYRGLANQAYRQHGDAEPERIQVSHFRGGTPTVVASRSHAGPETGEFIEQVRQACGDCSLRSLGSALKICLVAEGGADVYPRLGPTSEWDIAAAQSVLQGAGGRMATARGEPLQYNKESILNPWFVAAGASDFDWIGITRELSLQHEP